MKTDAPTATRTYLDAINEGYREVLRDVPEAFLIGEDLRASLMGTTKHLVDEFDERRILDMPISEQAQTGVAIGAAMRGKKPILEYQVNTTTHLTLDQIVNQGQLFRYLSGGRVSVPLTVALPGTGAQPGYAAQHSENTYPTLLNNGVKTVVPSTPRDAKGLLHSCVDEEDPTVIYWPGELLEERGEVPSDSYRVPLGSAEVRRAGEDLTLVAVGEMVPVALQAAQELAGTLSVEVVDPRCLLPLDRETIHRSVRSTGRAVVTENCRGTCGFAAELSASLNADLYDHLRAPVRRVTRADVPVSFSPEEEREVQPGVEDLTRVIEELTG